MQSLISHLSFVNRMYRRYLDGMCKGRPNIRTLIVVLWAVIAVFYIRFEAYPSWFTRTLPGYRGLLPDDVLTRESWSRVLISNQPAGYVHTIFTVDDDEPEPVLEITTRMQMRVNLLDTIQTITVFTEILLDQDYLPQSFNLSTSAGDFSLHVNAEHIGERAFEVTTYRGESSSTRTVTLPKDVVLYSPINEMAIQQLRPGRSLAVRTLDPLTLQTTTIMIHAGSRETIEIAGKPMRALSLETNWHGLTFRSWIRDDGQVLRQETPFGWIMETTEPDVALAAISDDKPAPSLLSGIGGLSLLQALIGAETTPQGP